MRERVVVLVKLPDEPVIVTVTVPVAAVLLAVRVNVLVPLVPCTIVKLLGDAERV